MGKIMSDRNDRAETPLQRSESAIDGPVAEFTGTNVPTVEASNVTEIVTLHDPMTHDPLCGGGDCDCTCDQMQDGHRVTCIYLDCECELIARVREDERMRDDDYAYVATQSYAAALRDAVEAVTATYALSWCGDRFNQCDDYEHACQERKQTVAAIEALRGES